jgi:hypothetical protein
MSELQ